MKVSALAILCLAFAMSSTLAQEAAEKAESPAPWMPPKPEKLETFSDDRAARMLGDLGAALSNKDETVRIRAVDDLTSEGTHPTFVKALIRVLSKDKSPAVRQRAAEQLERIGDPAATDALISALTSKSNEKEEFVLGASAMALARCADRPVFGKLKVSFLNGSAKVKKGLVLTFGQTKDLDALDTISVWIDEPVGNLGSRVNGETAWWAERHAEWEMIRGPVRWALWRTTGRGDFATTLEFRQWWKEEQKRRPKGKD